MTDRPASFRDGLERDGPPLVGMLCALVDPVAAEIVAGAGFDWVLLDAEHAPNSPRTVLAQLQAIASHPVAPVVRPASHDPALVKRYLDVGAHTLLVPMVDTPEQAAAVVASTRYPPDGIRGVGAALGRASQWGRDTAYLDRADDEVTVIAQVETRTAVANVEEICAVDGIHATLVGPSDLAASLGHLGDPDHPEVRAAVLDVIARTTAAGLPAGVFAPDPGFARTCVDAGARFVLVGTDVAALAGASDRARAGVHGAPTDDGSPAMRLRPVGVARTPYADRTACPRRPDPDGPECRIEVAESFLEALRGVDELDEVEVLLWFDHADRSVQRARRRGEESAPERGVFALRAPDRPNPIAVSRVPVVRVEGGTVVVRGLDAVDGTPVVDLKPVP